VAGLKPRPSEGHNQYRLLMQQSTITEITANEFVYAKLSDSAPMGVR